MKLADSEVRFLRDLLTALVFLDEDDRPIEPPQSCTQIIKKLTKVLSAVPSKNGD